MNRAQQVKQKAQEIIETGEKPSATRISQELKYPEQDIHRCLNTLERKKEIKTYTKEILGTKHRMIGIQRK